MKVRVKYFASIREKLGAGGETVETSASTCGALRDELIARGGLHAEALARGRAVRIALDQAMAAGQQAHDQRIDGVFLADDHAGHAGAQGRHLGAQGGHFLFIPVDRYTLPHGQAPKA